MEAFDCILTSRNHLEPTEFQTSGKPQLLETADISRQESCFMVFSSHKTREKKKTGPMNMRQVAVSTERKYFEDAGLEKLAFPVKSHAKNENEVLEEILLKVPNNNPFKKRKLDEIHIAETKDIAELVSSKGEDEKLEILGVFPDNSQLTFPVNSCISDGKLEVSNQMESNAEQISMVTEVDCSETMGINMGSQESVSSKTKRVFSGRGRGQNDKLKRSNCSNSRTRNSILNFFARV